MMPAAAAAMSVVHPGPPGLRVRYREGVLIDAHGFPDWLVYARAVVALPPPIAELNADEQRVWDVLAANRAMLGADPLWPEPTTPAGWCWAHLPPGDDSVDRLIALVPIELHGSFRHGGGFRTLPLDRQLRGVRTDETASPVGPAPGEAVPVEFVDQVETILSYGLPATYRRHLLATNGAGPREPGVLPGLGLLADQPLFGLARPDQYQDLGYAPRWLADRFTPEFLPIGYVQGGLLALRVTGSDAGSVWFLDDDDPRDDDSLGAREICDRLLHRCADDLDGFWAALRPPAAVLQEVADELVGAGQVRVVRPELAGAALPAAVRASWQSPPDRRAKGLESLLGELA